MKKSLVAITLAAISGYAAAQGGNGQFHQHGPSPQMEAFCSQHEADCAQLKALHETAAQTCHNPEAKVSDCESARQAAHAQMAKLEGEGLPAREHHDHDRGGQWQGPDSQ